MTDKPPYSYRVRPGYGSQELLIEFMGDCSTEEFQSTLLAFLEKIGIRVVNIMDLWMNDEVIYQMKCMDGEFDLSFSTWGFAFILTEKNPPVIAWLDEKLRESGLFVKEEVNFEQYRQPSTDHADQEGAPAPPEAAFAAESAMPTNTNRLRNYFNRLSLLVVGLTCLAVGLWLAGLTLPDLAPSQLLPPAEEQVLTVSELLARQGPLRVKVRGRFDFDDILVEKEYRTGHGSDRINTWNDFFYTLVDEATGAALYVRSDLRPYAFQQQFGIGPVTMPGIWQRPGSDTQIGMSKLWFQEMARQDTYRQEEAQKTDRAAVIDSPAERLARLKDRLDQNRWPSSNWVLTQDEPAWGIVLGKLLLLLLSAGIISSGVLILKVLFQELRPGRQ